MDLVGWSCNCGAVGGGVGWVRDAVWWVCGWFCVSAIAKEMLGLVLLSSMWFFALFRTSNLLFVFLIAVFFSLVLSSLSLGHPL